MKIKNLCYLLLAILFIASACTDDSELEPISETSQLSIDDLRGEDPEEDFTLELQCTTYTDQDTGDQVVIEGSCIWVTIDANAGPSSASGKKFKTGKAVTDCSYFTAAGFDCQTMISFQRELFFKTSDSEWEKIRGLSKELASKYVINAKIAIDKADQYFPGWEKNSKGDALRQAIASALNAKDLGVALTLELQTANESTTYLGGYSPLELQMKTTNEAFGRGLIVPYGPTLSATTLCNMVLYARANGGLVFIPPGASFVASTQDTQTPPDDDCPPGSGDEGPGGGGLPVGTC